MKKNKLKDLLTEAEAEAKRLADLHPENSTAQALRARVTSALELTSSPSLLSLDEPAAAGNEN